MNWKPIFRSACLATAVVCLSGGSPQAEVSALQHPDGGISTLTMAIVEHPDPVDVSAWILYRPDTSFHVLNPDGFFREDGRPDIGWSESGKPVVVWSYNLISDYDVALVEYLADGWTVPTFLTASTLDELDPRVIVGSDGRVHVTWWIDDVIDSVWIISRRVDKETWDPPVRATGLTESGRRPSLLEHEGRLLVAYERDSLESESSQEVVVAERLSDSTFSTSVIADTDRTERLDPILHQMGPTVWVDWKHSDNLFGHAETVDLGWHGWLATTWVDPSWIGVEETRRQIQQLVMP